MARSGPVVIDWTNAARGNPSVDVAITWILVASGEVLAGRTEAILLVMARKLLLNAFLKPFAREQLQSILSEVVEWKCTNPHMSAVEIARMRLLLERDGD